MEIPSEEEVVMAHRESEERASDAARHQWLDGLEEEGRKQLELVLAKAFQVVAASIGGGLPVAVTAERDGERENRQ